MKKSSKMAPRKAHTNRVQLCTRKMKYRFRLFLDSLSRGPRGHQEEHGVWARAFPGGKRGFLCSRSCPFCIFLGGCVSEGEAQEEDRIIYEE